VLPLLDLPGGDAGGVRAEDMNHLVARPFRPDRERAGQALVEVLQAENSLRDLLVVEVHLEPGDASRAQGGTQVVAEERLLIGVPEGQHQLHPTDSRAGSVTWK